MAVYLPSYSLISKPITRTSDAKHKSVTLTAFDRRQRLLSLMRGDPALRVSMIAELLGVSEGTVAATLSQAHRDLAKRLEREGVRP